VTHSYTAEKETFWIAHQADALESGVLEAEGQLDTGLLYLETYDDPREWNTRLNHLRADYPKALAAWLDVVRLRVPHEAINAERDRRVRLPFTFMGRRFDADERSIQRISGAATLAGFAIGAGVQPGNRRWHGGSTDFAWISADNEIVPMDAHTVFAFGQAAATNESAHVFAARVLKDSGVTEGIQNDEHWP
jgi:hypothetical protein